MIYTFKDLLYRDNKPRLHGNGFIQLDIVEDYRLHVWPENEIEAQHTYTPWHDHTFGFTSTVLLGYLIHTHYKLKDAGKFMGDYHLYEAVAAKGRNTFLERKEGTWDLETYSRRVLSADFQYGFPAYEFHTSEGIGLTATLIHKVQPAEKKEQGARVLCLSGKVPDNDFDRHSIKESVLWNEIRKVFDKIGHIQIDTYKDVKVIAQ